MPGSERVALNTFELGSGGTKEIFYKFEKGDTVEFKVQAPRKEKVDKFLVERYPGSLVYSLAEEREASNRIIMPERGVLRFYFKSNNLMFSKKYGFSLYRKNPAPEMASFSTAVTWSTRSDTSVVVKMVPVVIKTDTLSDVVLNKTIKVDAGTRTWFDFVIPDGTTTWAYWIGVGQEAEKQFQEFAGGLAQAGGALVMDPIAAFALNQVPALLQLNQGSPINYHLIQDVPSLNAFMARQQFRGLKHGVNVISDYAKMDTPRAGRVYVGLNNEGAILLARTVTIKVVAIKLVNQTRDEERREIVVQQVKIPE